jgi:hypothetical protein
MRRHTTLLIATLALLAGTSCSNADSAFAPLPRALASVAVDSVGIGARLRIGVEAATLVRVRYAPVDGSADALEVTAELSPIDSTITLTRLAHGRTYQFSATAVNAGGTAGPASVGQFSTPSLPADLASLQFEATGQPTDDVFMVEVRGTSGFNGLVAVDEHGTVVWYYRTAGSPQGATKRANGNYVINDLGTGLREVSPNGDVVHTLDYDFLGPTPHHDVIATPANTLLFISQDFRTPPGKPTIWGEAIYEWSPETGAVVKRWSAWDWYDPDLDWTPRSTNFDWMHANSLALGPHGNVVLSLNWLDQVISIAPDWSHIEWRLGGRTSTFALDSDAVFSGQHSASMPAEGRVLMFDNGRDRTGAGEFSRGLEIRLDTMAHRGAVAWQFRPAAGNYAPFLGLARRLANGNTLVFFGLPDGPFGDRVATGPISAYEARPDGSVAWKLLVNNAKSAYRGWPLASIGSEQVEP